MVGESNQNVFLIQIDASIFAEFEISEFEISRVDCTDIRALMDFEEWTCKIRDYSLKIGNKQVPSGN